MGLGSRQAARHRPGLHSWRSSRCAGCLHVIRAWAASQRRIAVLFADVSQTAEAFFQHRGFAVVSCQSVIRKDVAIPNARMTKQLLKEPQEPGYGGDHAEHEAFQRLRTELANAYAAPEASYQTLAAADVIARNRT